MGSRYEWLAAMDGRLLWTGGCHERAATMNSWLPCMSDRYGWAAAMSIDHHKAIMNRQPP